MGVGAGAAGLPAAWGLEDLDVALRECVKNSFHARHVAYMDEVRVRHVHVVMASISNI
jgi:hypothetical protein